MFYADSTHVQAGCVVGVQKFLILSRRARWTGQILTKRGEILVLYPRCWGMRPTHPWIADYKGFVSSCAACSLSRPYMPRRVTLGVRQEEGEERRGGERNEEH